MERAIANDSDLLVVGISHRTAPLELLERLYESPRPIDELITKVSGRPGIRAVMAVSTCNRIELYADATGDDDCRDAIAAALAEHSGICLDDLLPYLYAHAADDAVRQLFRVAAGLDSVVLGEEQILAQVKDALANAQRLGTAGRRLNQATQTALRVGKRVRNEAGLNEAGRSLATAGLTFFEQRIGTLHGKTALVVGAGAMAGVVMAALRQSGLAAVHVANRTPDKARRLAETGGGTGVPLEDVPGLMGEVDIVVSCAAASEPLIMPEHVRHAMAGRGDRPLFLLDLSLPRTVDPAAAEVPGAVLVDLRRIADEDGGDELSAAGVVAAHEIVDAEVGKFNNAQRAALAAPILTAMRTSAAAATKAELDRLARRLDSVDVEVREEINQSVRRIVDKVLHLPTVRVRQLAGRPDGATYVDALGKLFAPETHTSTVEEVLI